MEKIILAAVLVLFGFSSCNQKQPEQKEPMTTTSEAGIHVKLADLGSKKDLVCGMDLEEGSIADTASYDGKLYGFCSPECKQDFAKEPQKYLKSGS